MTRSKRKPDFWEEYGLEPWPGRYFVGAVVEGFRYKDSSFKVKMKMSMKDSIDYASIEESLGYLTFEDDEDWNKFSIIEELTFSEQQADELIAYLNSFECFHASKEQAFKPKDPLNWYESMIPISSDDFERRFYLQEGYPLDFKVIGYLLVK
jgi:hypothetical protein